MCIRWRVENTKAFDGISCYCCSWQPITRYLFYLFSSKHGSGCMVHPRLGKPVFLPCCTWIATSLLEAGWVMEKREGKLPWWLYFLFLFEAWNLQENWSGGMTDGIQMNCDKQASSCHSCKPRGREERKSSNQVRTVLFLFLPSVRAAGGWKGSGVI